MEKKRNDNNNNRLRKDCSPATEEGTTETLWGLVALPLSTWWRSGEVALDLMLLSSSHLSSSRRSPATFRNYNITTHRLESHRGWHHCVNDCLCFSRDVGYICIRVIHMIPRSYEQQLGEKLICLENIERWVGND